METNKFGISSSRRTCRPTDMHVTRNTALLVAGTVGLTLLAISVAFNLMSGEKKIERRIERLYSLEDPRFAHELGVLLGPEFVEGNRHNVLRNGDEIFPAMLAAIRSGKTSINFETYIYWSGAIGQEFADALAERSRQGSAPFPHR